VLITTSIINLSLPDHTLTYSARQAIECGLILSGIVIVHEADMPPMPIDIPF